MIDLHAHILPGLDDGPQSLEEAIAMARVASAAGTRALATTSHVEHRFALSPADLATARDALAQHLAEAGIELELLAGGEIAPERLADLDDEALRGLTLGGGPYVLLECPLSTGDSGLGHMVADLQRRGFGVLLGHPERSPTFLRDPGRLAALTARGTLAQVTTGSLAGAFGQVVQRAATAMLEQGLVHVLASDAHDAVRRAPDLRIPDLLDEAQHTWMTGDAPAAIVAGRPLPERPPLPRPRGLRARLARRPRGS
jgi:protein-tyrosine phosphatase